MIEWFSKMLDGLKGAAAIRFIAPLIKSLTPWIVTACVYIGVEPELANEFAHNLTAVVLVLATFLIDMALTYARARKIVKVD